MTPRTADFIYSWKFRHLTIRYWSSEWSEPCSVWRFLRAVCNRLVRGYSVTIKFE